MDTINIICKLNENDKFSISCDSLEVNLTNKNHYHYTFWESGKNKSLLQLPSFYSVEGLDILYLSLFVYYADRRIQREMYPDAWTRKIKLYVPVLSLDKWNKEKALTEEMLSFLSGDKLTIEFRQRKLNEIEKKFQEKLAKSKEDKLSFNRFCMLSGGLDSFIGAIDLLDTSNDLAFVGHYGGGTSGRKHQDLVKTSLTNEYDLTEHNFFNFHASPLNGIEDTTRTRSFMFFAHAIVLASSMKEDIKLIIPENGFISLNIPLTNSRLGSSSTRTTHPYYLELLQKLLKNLEIPIGLENPYQFKTKGEMILECKNKDLLEENIINTMSCSHPDQGRRKKGGKPAQHCGTCFPCIIRRASIKKAKIQDTSFYRDPNFSAGRTASNNLNTYRIGIRKYENNSSINNYFRVQMSGPLYNNLSEYKSLYERGMLELIELLEEFND